jgi:hypothetical protein
MSLPTTNLAVSAVRAETGVDSYSVATLVGASGLNAYSFYGPGTLDVDANYDVVLTPATSPYKLGDFRAYNHSSKTPRVQSDYDLWYSSGDSTITFMMAWFPEGMNIKEFAEPGDYVTLNFYPSSNDRANEGTQMHQEILPITFNEITPLVGHTRDTGYRAGSTQLHHLMYMLIHILVI